MNSSEQPGRTVTVNGVEVRLNLDESLHASVLRTLVGTTPADTNIDSLALPSGPLWLQVSVKLLRWYRTKISPALGQRCVYEPSCSRYAELALRKRGFIKGIILTAKRLHRCRPGSGGIDLP